MYTPARGWCSVTEEGSETQGTPMYLPCRDHRQPSVLIDSAWPLWLGALCGQFPLQGKKQPLVPGALTWGVGSKARAEEGPQEEDLGILGPKMIPKPGRDDQTGLLLYPSALSSPPPKAPMFLQLLS